MVEKKRFDGSDATGATGATGAARATGMLRALRARAAASGAGRGVIAAVTSVAAVAMLGAVCVTPASALADVNADADASGVRSAASATASDGTSSDARSQARSATSATRPVANGVTVADETAADAMPDNPNAELPDKVSAEISDDATVVSEQYAATPEGELKDIETGETVTDPKIVGTESKQPDPLAKTDGESFIPVSAADVKEKVAANGGDVNAVSSKTRADNASVKLAALQNNEYGAHWGTYNGTQAFFDARNNLFAQQAKGVIDVSAWQNTIDWQAVKNAGVEGAIIRLSYGWGNGFDVQAKRNISECKRLGIPFGVYVFSYAESAADGASEGADVVNLLRQAGVNPGDLSYPVFYDLENWTYTGHKSPTSPSVYDGMVNSWYGKLQAAGYNNLSVYSYTSYLNSALNSSNIHGKTRWVAQYGSTMQYTAFPTNDRGWQYTSSGQISGITGNVDLNAFGYRTPTTRYREVLIDGKWYYIDATTGKKVTGWQWLSSSGGKWVYYDPTDGHMLYGEQKIAGKWYYLDPGTGARVTGWTYLKGDVNKWTYYGQDGAMLYGEQKIAGKWYYLNPVSGARMTGWVVLPDGRNVYYSPYMVYGEQKINGAWYYLDPVTGARKQGWQRLKSNGGKTVYYGSDGKMAYGEQTIDGKQYYLKLGTGARFAGWRRVVTTRDHRGDKWVYYGSDGAMLHGEGKVSGYWYFFDDGTSKSNGRVTYGWKNLGSKIVYYSWPEGKMQYGEQKIGGAWYYLNPMTGARKTGWQYLNSNGGKTVYYGSDGKMVYGTQYIDGQKYYFDPVTGAKR
ncbi:glycoside hydrolase [Bifidobacterium longum]|uniref:GH25 family lysozyme n=3 Tax=Bifidobacterium longum TaxID=216816 RepID=UPI000E44A960|nr:GH25 family lysozyme [Bifidobacterium longum]RGM09897.1 glycoside hydrolase [Bifidobacterium longum]